MDKKRRLLLVEDIPMQFENLKQRLETAGWLISPADDETSALKQISRVWGEASPVEIAVVDLGLPPGIDNPWRGGMPLIKKLRARQNNLPILAYTNLTPKAVNYAQLVAELMPLRVSFVFLRRIIPPPTLPEIIELVWKGFFLLSPVPADSLVDAIADRPDPLTTEQWDTLQQLSHNLVHKEIARKGNISKETVKKRVSRIKEILVDNDELDYYQADTKGIIDWYRANYIRYRRY